MAWAYTVGSWRAANATTTTGVTRVEFVIGLAAEPVQIEAFVPSVSNNSWSGPASWSGN